MARMVNLLLVGSRCMNRCMTRQPIKVSPSGEHSPWLIGSFLRPSNSQRKPSFSTKATKCVSTLLVTLVFPFFTESRCCWNISLLTLNPSPTSAGVLPNDSSANLVKWEFSRTRSGQSQRLFIMTWKRAMVPQAFLAYCFIKKMFSVTLFFWREAASAFSQSRCNSLISQRKTSPNTGWPNISCAHSSTDSTSCTLYQSAFMPKSLRKAVMTQGFDSIGSQLSSSLLSILSYYTPLPNQTPPFPLTIVRPFAYGAGERGVGCTKIILTGMEQTMQHFNQYTTDSQLQWPGITSNKFPRPRLIHPPRDIIKTGLDLPDETFHSGRKHFQPQRSGQFVFRPRLKQVGEMEHWHLRPSNKRILDLQFSQPHPRRQRGHFPVNNSTSTQEVDFAGIRTFYNTRLRDGVKEYSLEDRIQRKVRVDQLSLRKSAFQNESFSMSLKGRKF